MKESITSIITFKNTGKYNIKEIKTFSVRKPERDDGSKTTEIYTHVSKANLAKIENPLDRMMKEKGI